MAVNDIHLLSYGLSIGITDQFVAFPLSIQLKQVAQWATTAHHGASIMFGDTIIYDVQRQITLNLKQ